MVYPQQNDDWIENATVGAALAGLTSFTVSCWLRPSPSGTAPVPIAFSIANDVAAPVQWLALLGIGGVWAFFYDDGAGPVFDAVAPGEDAWRFVALVFSPGTTPGTWKIETYSRKADGTAVWDYQFTYDNFYRAANNTWAAASIASPLGAATFGYFGHLQHFKVWGRALTGDQLWRESQLAAPSVTDDLVTWNPLAIEWDGQFYRQQQGSAGGGFTTVGASPAADELHAPLQIRPGPPQLVLGVPSPNPTLTPGGLQLAAVENLQVRTGLAARLGTGALAFVGGCLTVAGASLPALGPGSLQLAGYPLTAAVALAAPLEPGQITLSGAPLTASDGAGATIAPGGLSWQGGQLAAALGLAAPLAPGGLLLLADGLQPVGGEPPTIIEGFDATVADDAPAATVATADVVATVADDAVATVADPGVAVTAAPEGLDVATDDGPSATVS